MSEPSSTAIAARQLVAAAGLWMHGGLDVRNFRTREGLGPLKGTVIRGRSFHGVLPAHEKNRGNLKERAARERILLDVHTIDLRRNPVELSPGEKDGSRLGLQTITEYSFTVSLEKGQPAAVQCDPACAAVTGYTAAEYQANSCLWYSTVAADDRPAFSMCVANMLSGKAVRSLEHRVVHKSGETRWVKTTLVPDVQESGVPRFHGVVTEMTTRKEAERALLQERSLLSHFFALSLDLFCIAGFDGYFKHLNPSWTDVLGLSREELMARPYLEFVHPADRPATIKASQELLRGSEIVSFENRYRCKDNGYRWLLWSACPSPEEQLIYATARDITRNKNEEQGLREANAESRRSEEALRSALDELRQAHQELKATQLRLIQTAKLEATGTLAAGVAHEVKNPLQIIVMGIDYLAGQFGSGQDVATAVLQDMRGAIARADRIVRGLLEFSAAYRADIKDEDLNEIIESSLELVKFELAKARVSVRKLLAEELPKLKLDKAKIQQVFINLFVNAIHSMPHGGTLTVGTYVRKLADIDLNVGDRQTGQLRLGDTVAFKVGDTAVVAEVEDTGKGIPEEQLPRIFDPFFSTKPTGQGTGLGLTVVKTIIDLHGGTIDIRNRRGGGVVVSSIFKTWKEEG